MGSIRELEEKIWCYMYQEFIMEHNFEAVDQDFWEEFKSGNDCEHSVEDLEMYYETSMKNNLYKAKLNQRFILALYKHMKIPISKIAEPEICRKFSIAMKLSDERLLLDYDHVRKTPVKHHPIFSEREAARRKIHRRECFTIDDKLRMAHYLYKRMEDAEKEGREIFPKGNLIWRDYRIHVDSGRGVYNYQSHYTRQMTKYLYTLPMNREKILRMYRAFKIEVDADTQRRISNQFNVELWVRENLIIDWEVAEENDDEDVSRVSANQSIVSV